MCSAYGAFVVLVHTYCMDLYRAIAPTTTLISLAEFKAWAGIYHDVLDAAYTELIEAASQQIELDTNVQFRPQTWVWTQEAWTPIYTLPVYPVSAVAITYYDQDNVLQTLSSTNFILVPNQYEVRLYLDDTSTRVYDRPDAIQITMTCGYSTIPALAKACCRSLASHWDRNREATTERNLRDTPEGYQRTIQILRRGRQIV